MATYKHLRSSTANKRPTTTIVDGQLAINTNTASPGLFFKDSAGTGIVKVGPVHVGTTAPNSVPASGGSSGNYTGEQWLDTSVSPAQMKVWNGSTWVGIVADELPVSKLQDGAARQLIQTDAAGTGVEWTSNVDVPGTLDVTSTATFDSIAQHPLGTAGAPTITFTGDTNTGIYSPGADQVAISTNGTGRLFVDENGGVGIGYLPITTRALDIGSRDTATGIGAAITIRANSAANAGAIQFTNSNASAQNFVIAADTSNNLKFLNNSNFELMRLDSSGRLGLGTSSPQTLLHLNSAAGTNTTLAYAEDNALKWYNRYNASDGSFQIVDVVNTTTRLHVSNTGNVGIGTTSPADTFDCRGDARVQAGNVRFMIRPSSGTSGWLQFSEDGVADRWSVGIANGDSSLIFKTGGNFSGTERCRLDGSGRLLVGTSSNAGASRLQVIGDSSATTNPGKVRIGTGYTAAAFSGPTELGQVNFGPSDDVTAAQISAWYDVNGTGSTSDFPGRLIFSTTADGASSPTERMRITSAGSAQFAAATTGIVSGSVSGAGTTFTTFIGQHSTASGPGTGTNSFLVYTNGDVQNTNNSYGAFSDLKLKENIVDALSQWDDIKALQVRKYNFKKGQAHTQIGLIAQEVELVSPGLVSESPDRDAEGNDLGTVTKSVNYSVLYMKAVKALQEAMERIEVLEQRLTDAGIA
jgi:hypothetical protein